MSSSYSSVKKPHIFKRGKILNFKDLEDKKDLGPGKNYTFSSEIPKLQTLVSSTNNINQVLARVWLKIAKLSSFFGLEKDKSQQLRKKPSVFNNFATLLRGGEVDQETQLLLSNFLLTLDNHTQKLEEINNKIYPRILLDNRIKALEKSLEEVCIAIRKLV